MKKHSLIIPFLNLFFSNIFLLAVLFSLISNVFAQPSAEITISQELAVSRQWIVQELENKSGGFTESELLASGRTGKLQSDGKMSFQGFYIALSGKYIPIDEKTLKGIESIQELERKSGGYTESELIASGRIKVEGSDGTLFFSGFSKAPNGNYFPLNDNALMGQMGQTIQPISTPAKTDNESIPKEPLIDYQRPKYRNTFRKFENVDCSDWKKPCTVATARDINSGLLLDWIRYSAPEFSESVYPNFTLIPKSGTFLIKGKYVNKIYTLSVILGSDLGKNNGDKSWLWSDFDRKPIRMISHFKINKDPSQKLLLPIFVDVAQVLNPTDRSVGYLFFVTCAEVDDGSKSIFAVHREKALQNNLYILPNANSWTTPSKPEDFFKKGDEIVIDAQFFSEDEVRNLLLEWSRTNIFPKALEGRLLDPDF